GIAALIVAMAIIRRVFHLGEFFRPIHFNNLGLLLLTMACLWFYFTFAAYLTGYYGNEPEEMKVFWSKFTGPFWMTFWAMLACNFVVPMACLVHLGRHAVGKTVVASVAVVIGMWLERLNIIVPTLSNPRLPFPEGQYWPTWVEWGETAGSFGVFILLYVLFVKLFPIISIWEIKEGREVGLKEVEERLRTYLPDATEPEPARDRAKVLT
ncbi:MAG: hypothetical protein HYV93_24130, partial [Candidatus Rokubacteria bacterium]|nr:hypothetical protein [Candidatus Rokubacteria bacterium]